MSKDYNYPDKVPTSKPPILTDVYGSRPPKAAQFGVGISDRRGAQEAADARRAQRPGDAEKRLQCHF
jgi:hypothetical protein